MKKNLEFYVPEARSYYEASHSGGLRFNSDHLVLFNMYTMHTYYMAVIAFHPHRNVSAAAGI